MPHATPTRSSIEWQSPAPSATIARADWLDVASSLPAGAIDLVYADPPFNTGRMQSGAAGDYQDAWLTLDHYLDWLRERLGATIPLLKPTGCLLLHLDWRTVHHARVILDDLLGSGHFVNHLIWSYGLGGSSPRRFARKHDDILFYCLDPDLYYFDPPMIPATSRRLEGQLKKATDVLDIPAINNMAHERVGWPTQKPLALLKLLVNACCPSEGTVLDPCCGSGTTLLAAVQSDRCAVGADIDPRAVQIASRRLRETLKSPAPRSSRRSQASRSLRPTAATA